ncbi:MAG: glycoside hydrolase/phage tail family protein [Rhizomicrobium sp.]|nr:glycoside hydrolase/phage tail family protein [Rhizomicrobium sp.]
MASLVLGAAGSALGASFGGISFLGVSLSGAQIGGALGSIAGSAIDAALLPSVHRYGPRLTGTALQTAREGAPIPRLYGRMRLSGQLLWASRFREASTTAGGKGSAAESTTYSYTISFAVGLCEGPITRLGRIWADGNLLDPSLYSMRLYRGDDSQSPDPLIEEIEGAGNSPAYRGLCYVVFEDMKLAAFGNRIPQLQFEVVRALGADNPATLENRLTSVALIPGAGEFVCAPETVTEDDGAGTTIALNAHNTSGVSDFTASLDELLALAPNLKSVSLVVGWFGNDLRCGLCQIRPGVEQRARATYPESWSVAGIARGDAYLISTRDGRPAYGGTPSDASVSAALAALQARGLSVTFYPFLFMDIAPGNTLPNPASNTTGQPAYPWRGRLTVSSDQTAEAAAQINAFFAAYRPMLLHYAQLCADAGGVESFLIGSELVGLTRARSDAATYPAVTALKQLAADVHTILPNAKLGYGADWSEYSGHALGGGAFRFNLDPLWSDPNIAFVGIDNYLPLTDWREAGSNRDGADYASPYDPAYLTANIRGGEDYDWYYASPAARDAQNRSAISDGLGKPWLWRAKDIWQWWANRHYDRPDGSESATATAWVPQSKPIRFTELGCPAVDKGANQPNVFYDPKSTESLFPYYSSGQRDDLIQRRFLEAHLNYWRDAANNPISSVTGAPMLDSDHLAVWCWDARPFPFFPARDDVWGDAANYATGHWLNGRLGDVALSDLVTRLCADAGFTAIDSSGLAGLVTGYAVTDSMSVREALAPLMAAYFFDAVETGGVIRFVMRGSTAPLALSESDLVASEGFGFSLKRTEASDVPAASRLSYLDAGSYDEAVAQTRRLSASTRVASSSLPLVLDQAEAAAINERLLSDAAVMAERASFALPPSRLALDPSDEILLSAGGRQRRLRLTAIADAGQRACDAVATDPSVYAPLVGASRSVAQPQILPQLGRPLLVLLDLPWLSEAQNPTSPFAAAFADPWPGQVVLYKDGARVLSLSQPATIGETLADFWSGPLNRFDRINTLTLKLYHGSLLSVSDAALFAGANLLALQNAAGAWEVLQFGTAELIAPNTWRLSRLLRGRQATEQAMASPLAAGARVVLLDSALQQIPLTQAEALLPHSYTYGPQGRALADPAFQTRTECFAAAGLVPPAPCHLGFAWSGADLILRWLRRDRAPAANSLLLAETPASDPLLFDLEILSGATVIRTFSNLPQNSQLYTAAQQASDFPSGLPNPLVIRVAQRSSVLGRGRAKTEALYVR